MRITSFNCAPLGCTVMFLCIGQMLCQEGPCGTQQLLAELTSILEAKFALLDETFLDIGNRLSGVEHALSQNQILQENTLSNLDDVKDDLSQEMQELKSQVSLLEDNLNEELENKTSLQVSTMNTTVNDGVICPESEGFFMIQGTSQCLKVFREDRTWDDAVEYCTSLGLKLLAKPEDPLALQAYLNNKYIVKWGGGEYWVNGVGGDGSLWRWSDGSVLHSEDPLWADGRPDSVTRTSCLLLSTYDSKVKVATPYWDYPCYATRPHICEHRVRLG